MSSVNPLGSVVISRNSALLKNSPGSSEPERISVHIGEVVSPDAGLLNRYDAHTLVHPIIICCICSSSRSECA